jgi:hypothetical protein
MSLLDTPYPHPNHGTMIRFLVEACADELKKDFERRVRNTAIPDRMAVRFNRSAG